MNDQKNFIEIYKQEAKELLAEIEETVLEIEENPGDKELINRLFRAVHTIKGSGGMFGFDKIVDFTHHLESALDKVREGLLPVTKEMIDLILKSKDHIQSILESAETGNQIDDVKEKHIIDGLNCLLSTMDKVVSGSEPEKKALDTDPVIEDKETTYRIRFRPDIKIFLTGTDPSFLLDELRDIGECEIIPFTKDIPVMEDLDPEKCHIFWDIILTTRKGPEAIKDVFIFVGDDCEIIIDVIDEEADFEDTSDPKKIGEILVERNDISKDDIDKALHTQKRLGELLVETDMLDKQTVESALIEQNQIKKIREKRREEKVASSLRVAAEKLDTLVDLVGELVTVQARLSQVSSTEEHSDILAIAEEVERLTAELRDNTMSIRMMPIGSTFSKFKRLVRDLSNELGKEVVLTTDGSDTELDKTVIDQLNDPLVHIIRNSIDHGIEPPEFREKNDKPRWGTVHLAAEHSGANVLIRISDDGRGLDPEAIFAKALEKGLVSPDAELTESEIFSQILMPGFSTAKAVTDVSGRGVGMDVVKRAIESLRGTLEIDSKKGSGTTIILKLPLTLAIIDGLLMQIGKTHFVISLSSVDECVELTRQDATNTHGRHIMKVRDELVPYIPLRELFGINSDLPPVEQIVITKLEGHRIGFAVDQIIGKHQTVIKNLGKIYQDAPGFSGATILADGTVALILDVNGLSEIARMEERSGG